MNLDEYYMCAMNYILEEAQKNDNEEGVEQILVEAKIKEELLFQHLKQKGDDFKVQKATFRNLA